MMMMFTIHRNFPLWDFTRLEVSAAVIVGWMEERKNNILFVYKIIFISFLSSPSPRQTLKNFVIFVCWTKWNLLAYTKKLKSMMCGILDIFCCSAKNRTKYRNYISWDLLLLFFPVARVRIVEWYFVIM